VRVRLCLYCFFAYTARHQVHWHLWKTKSKKATGWLSSQAAASSSSLAEEALKSASHCRGGASAKKRPWGETDSRFFVRASPAIANWLIYSGGGRASQERLRIAIANTNRHGGRGRRLWVSVPTFAGNLAPSQGKYSKLEARAPQKPPLRVKCARLIFACAAADPQRNAK